MHKKKNRPVAVHKKREIRRNVSSSERVYTAQLGSADNYRATCDPEKLFSTERTRSLAHGAACQCRNINYIMSDSCCASISVVYRSQARG